MNIKKIAVLSSATLMLVATSVSPVLGLNSTVFAAEIGTKVDKINDLPESKLFTDAVANKNPKFSVNVSYDGDTKISQLLDENLNAVATEISNPTTSEILAVKRTDKEVIVEKTIKGYDGNYVVNTEHFAYATIDESTNPINISPRYYYTPWRYTNIAVGTNLFSFLTDLSVGAVVAFTANVFGITAKAADLLLGYMGAKGLSTGEAIAAALDTNGNGWIGLYVREMWNDSQTVFIGTEYKTM
ncbi:hypothetical protein [Enterococcus hirae]|uniref:hypothetical protein n=1 Tax=Enterococcus TaxID=1350 RepID=UPI0004DA6958|nr:hypothetical protein [Enterococcus hirae]EMF0156402.1 hypothetical protein [Enterococcus hirae]KDR92335.1 hypothetical protein EI18_11365 [Enterococcus hirae]MBA5257940.1 hypothetical protein [Enterococcus hirae]MCO5490669.1 hypothetical protein [Enterococcus hirae]QQB24315.1 hypothetical protein I6I14_07910 [Enterococcus hirae]